MLPRKLLKLVSWAKSVMWKPATAKAGSWEITGVAGIKKTNGCGVTPQPFVFFIPATPVISHEPALAVAGFHMTDFAQLTSFNNFLGSMKCGHVAIGQVHHIDELVLMCRGCHLISQRKILS